MKIFAIADLHLSFGVEGKNMKEFGSKWKDFEKRIQTNWKKLISKEDLVLIPGDISWAMKLDDAKIDLDWIDNLPGKKILIKGNHDYWWPSISKLKENLPPSIQAIQNNVIEMDDVVITGSRLWDSKEYTFNEYIDYVPNPKEKKKPFSSEEQEKIFQRELVRLENCLKQIHQNAKTKIVMTHYPPIGNDLCLSEASKLFEKYQIDHVVFGHLHNLKENLKLFGKARGVEYHLVSCDYLDFIPKEIQFNL